MRKPLYALCSLLLVAGLAACGDDDGDGGENVFGGGSGSEEEASGSEEEASGSGDFGDYCDTAEAIRDTVGDDDLDFTDPDAIDDASNALDALAREAPDEISDDFELVLDAFETLADAAREADGDEEALNEQLADFEEEFEDFGEATERIDEFTEEECGFTIGDEEDGSDTTADGDGEDTSTEDFADLIDECEGGDMAACDELFLNTPVGSEAEDIGRFCGGRADEPTAGQCEAEFG